MDNSITDTPDLIDVEPLDGYLIHAAHPNWMYPERQAIGLYDIPGRRVWFTLCGGRNRLRGCLARIQDGAYVAFDDDREPGVREGFDGRNYHTVCPSCIRLAKIERQGGAE